MHTSRTPTQRLRYHLLRALQHALILLFGRLALPGRLPDVKPLACIAGPARLLTNGNIRHPARGGCCVACLSACLAYGDRQTNSMNKGGKRTRLRRSADLLSHTAGGSQLALCAGIVPGWRDWV